MRLFCTMVLAAATMGGGKPAEPASEGTKRAFERLKSLAGRWEGRQDGKPAHVTYEVVSNGSAVMERMGAEGEAEMVSLYHLDGDSILMTHYCTLGNQPRMRCTPRRGADELTFVLVDVSNLASPESGHIHGLTLKTGEPGRLVQEWGYREKGQDSKTVFTFSRKGA